MSLTTCIQGPPLYKDHLVNSACTIGKETTSLLGPLFLRPRGGRYRQISLYKISNSPCRYYTANVPVIIVADPDIIKQIMVKQFDNFRDRDVSIDFQCTYVYTCGFVQCECTMCLYHLRYNYRYYDCTYSYMQRSVANICSVLQRLLEFLAKPPFLLFARGDTWTTLRQTLSPSFSAAKMKMVLLLVCLSVYVTYHCISDGSTYPKEH